MFDNVKNSDVLLKIQGISIHFTNVLQFIV